MTSSGRLGRRIGLVSALAVGAGALLAPLVAAAPAYASTVCGFESAQVGYGNASPLALVIFSSQGTALGLVQFSSGGSTLGTATVSTDQAGQQAGVLNYTFPAPGDYPITASYSGNFGTCSSSGVAVVIPAGTKTTVTSSQNPSVAGQQVTFTATVAVGTGGTPNLTGAVTFLDGTTPLGPSVTVNSSGVATLSTSALALGSHKITVRYGGDTDFLPSTSAAVVQNVDTDLSQYLTPDGTYALNDINLSGAYLAGANLAGADIVNANLSGVNLTGANLTGADLTDANFKNANLSGANLTDANLTRTNFKGAGGMSSATLTGATWKSTTCPDNTNSNNDGGTCANNLTP
jgi:hypothetical protein